MKLKDITKEELESMSFVELAQLILEEKNTKMKIVDVFKKICKVLGLSDVDFENKVADFFELVSTDKNFIVLDKGYCDLRKKHAPKVIIEEDEDEEEIENESDYEDSIEEEETESEDDIFYDNSSDEDDVEDEDELADFAVEEEEETSI